MGTSEDSVPHDLTAEEAGGMTVNERLYVAGLFDDFYRAASEQDEQELRRICERVHLGRGNTDVLVKKYISDK
jgi:hypothetical protein